MILRFLFYAFLIYMLYKFIFNFALPVYRTTRRVKKSFREMNEKMQQQNPGAAQPNTSTTQAKPKENSPGEYIDFEEVKE